MIHALVKNLSMRLTPVFVSMLPSIAFAGEYVALLGSPPHCVETPLP